MNDDEEFILGKSAFHGQTTIHPVGMSLVIFLGILLLFLPRRRAMIAVVACASLIAVGQRVVIFDLDFNFLRILVLFGWARIFIQQEYRWFRWQPMDKWFLLWITTELILYVMSSGMVVFVYRLGITFEAVGMYFIVRMVVRDLDDVRGLVEAAAYISLIVVCLFMYEKKTARNLFAVFGGVPEITVIRQGKLRCQGAYAHPILAGCFWAVLVPMIFSRIFSPGFGRVIACLGLFGSLGIIYLSSSSTPIVGVIAAIVGFAVFPIRRHMKALRWSIVVVLTCLHFSMNKPVWHLIARTDLIGGSTGWHRYHVINQFINFFREWALMGVRDVTHWEIFCNDITNQYACEGIRGGFPTLALFIYMISLGFGNVGRLWRSVEHSPGDLMMAWGIGVSFLVHIVNFFGVCYFGQIDMLWYISLALCAVRPVCKAKGELKNSSSISRQINYSNDSIAYLRT